MSKRASPGADSAKNGNPLAEAELSDENAQKLQALLKEQARVELINDRLTQPRLDAFYEKRRPQLKAIPKFWAHALAVSPVGLTTLQHSQDQIALSYLEELWVERDTQEPRAFTLEFHFKQNPFFTDAVLKKAYKYLPPPDADSHKPDADGITPAMQDFNWERDVEAQAIKINWTDDAHNLTKQFPAVKDDPEDDFPEPGSFFNLFETAEDPFDWGVTLANDFYPEAVEYFTGQHNEEDIGSDDEDDEDEDEEEIDLEKPRPKKQKN